MQEESHLIPLQSVVPNNPVHYFTSDCLKMHPSHFPAVIRAACHSLPGMLHLSHCGRGRWSHTLPCTSPGPSFQILFQRKCLKTRTKIIVFSSGSLSGVSKSKPKGSYPRHMFSSMIVRRQIATVRC